MTSMVQTDLGPPPATKYKEEPVDDPLRHHSSGHQGPPITLQHPRSSYIQAPKQHPSPPHQPTTSIPPGAYTPHALGNGVIQHQTHYGPPPQEPAYYAPHTSSYTTASTPGQYPSSGPPDLMATSAQMQRPYPPMYHTPQSSSPASVASHPHDHHGRSLYTQSPQMPPQMYGYQPYPAMSTVPPSPYAPHPSPQQHPLTSQSLMMSHQTSAAQVHPTHAATAAMTSPRTTQQPTPEQRAVLSPPHPGAAGASIATSSVVHHQSPSVGTSSSAAPGPIPATTPLVVRQDSNGVQWIAFEYSRDRVKMEYTIRCDVESVNVDNLSQDFKTENCVYPRACCSKDQYKGNRLVYETECNAVGWALAELNPALRGKRGLIQRAVDSWRNSNQDPRLRSRRVRRMAKVSKRQTASAHQTPHLGTAAPVAPGIPGAVMATGGPRPGLGPLTMGPPQLHHHHAQPDANEEVSGVAEFTHHRPSTTESHAPPGHAPSELRTAQVFHGYPAFPHPTGPGDAKGPSMPPLLRDSGIGALGRHHAVATSINRASEAETNDDDDDERNPSNEDLFGTLPEGKRRKFILVDDTQRGCRVRVKVMLDNVDMDELPDSYRESNAVYPRTYFPVQMKNPPNRVVPGKRYFRDDGDMGDDEEIATIGKTMVPAPSLDGENEIAVPKLSRGRRKKDILLNDLGYRMSWSQSRVFAGRMLFLQRSLDAYRNKMRSTMLAGGQDASSIPSHFETRAGKRRFLERGKRQPLSGVQNASKRSAEEVEA